MGGLVVKKAYILGQNDPQYIDLIQSIRSIVFLSTPHRGTHLAKILNKILSVSILNRSPKQYVTDLEQNSPTLQDINDQFRNLAPKLQIVSMYETQPTSVGPRKMMVLEKDSSILGYPNEISKGLEADHHNVCKFANTEDPNYVSVRNILRSLLGRFGTREPPKELYDKDTLDPQKLEKFLGVAAPPVDDHEFFLDRWMPGSCEWISADKNFSSWVEDESLQSRVLWVHGVPGAGKSVLSSFVVKHLGDIGVPTQFFFFRYGEHSKRSTSALLRSIAHQTACAVPEYGAVLSRMADDIETVSKADARSLWQKLFVSALFPLRLSRPLFWLIDALDECDAPQQLLSFLSDIRRSHVPIRIQLVSRKTQALSMAIQRMAENLEVAELAMDRTGKDLYQYVTSEIKYVPGRPEFKTRISGKILDAAHGNFLWVHLVLKNVAQCHTEAAIEETLDELPTELEPLYRRMESSLCLNSHPRDRALTKTILTWIACSRLPLTVGELSEALAPEHSDILDLHHTIIQLCGGFVTIDKQNHLTMVHQTAREFLTKTQGLDLSISLRHAHRELFLKCLATLSSSHKRKRSELILSQPFIQYASTSWFYHLALSFISLDHLQTIMLMKFFQGPSVLAWIQLLALTGQLRCLVLSSQSVASYLGKQAKIDAESSPLSQRLQEKECLEFWATDLIKILGRFGSNLTRHPRSIHRLIPAFCPTNSMLYRQFASRNSSGSLKVTGLLNTAWDDCLAKIHVSRDLQVLKIECGARFFAVLTSNGVITLYYTATCEEVRNFAHGERILCFAFDDSWQRLATYGFLTTKTWAVRSGDEVCCFSNPRNAKALAISFVRDEDSIVACSDDRAIRKVSLAFPDEGWTMLEASPGGHGFGGKQYNSPRRVAFNPDGSQLAIAYRGFPLVIYATDTQSVVGYCERLSDRNKRSQDLWTDIGPICWNAVTGHVLGLYNDGCIFKWHPSDMESNELNTVAADIRCSVNGNVFGTSSTDGTLRVWDFHHFALIYSLSFHTPVTDLAISPDGGRIYDLRDSFCHIWEPNALIRMLEAEDEVSDTSSTLGGLSQASEASSEMLSPITALGVNPQDSSYCVGDDNGLLSLHRPADKSSVQLASTFLPVEHAVWSSDGTILATADLGGRLSVWEISRSASANRLNPRFEANTGKNIRQLLLSQQSNYLLAVTQDTKALWSLEAKAMIVTRSSEATSPKWIYHPYRADLVLEVDDRKIRVHSWENLALIASVNLDVTTFENRFQGLDITHKASLAGGKDQSSITKVLASSDGSRLVLQISEAATGRQHTNRIIIVPTSNVPTMQVQVQETVTKTTSLPQTVGSNIECLIGLVGSGARRGSSAGYDQGNILVFLDKESWVCSWTMGGSETEATLTRHFFLPQDWLNSDYFRLSAISEDGTLFIPRNGEVAVIYNGLREVWFD